jgi:hypothetical protein
MRRLTADCDRVIVAGLLTSDSANFNTQHMLKLLQVMMEIRISEDYCRSDIYVLDYGNISLGHLSKVTPSYVKKYELCVLVSTTNIVLINNATNACDSAKDIDYQL